jgi:LysR family cys regulon transcriptional activator
LDLDQLRYVVSVYENRCRAAAAARQLGRSQPVISRQIQFLERELGFAIFERHGRSYSRVTPEGEQLIERAAAVLRETQELRRHAENQRAPAQGTLSVATTHTQARYVLPPVIGGFRGEHPEVALHLHAGTTEQIAGLVTAHRADVAIASGRSGAFADLLRLPCYRWPFRLVVPPGHPLARLPHPSLADVADYPLITYTFSLSGASSLLGAFEACGCTAKVALTAGNADVIKTYVRLGLGVGVIAAMAWQPEDSRHLVSIDAGHLFDERTTWVALRRIGVVRDYVYRFIEAFAPHLPRSLVSEVRRIGTQQEVDAVLADLHVPQRR